MIGIGSPLWWGAFFNLFGYIGGRDAERRVAGGDGLDAGTGEIAAREIKMGPLRIAEGPHFVRRDGIAGRGDLHGDGEP